MRFIPERRNYKPEIRNSLRLFEAWQDEKDLSLKLRHLTRLSYIGRRKSHMPLNLHMWYNNLTPDFSNRVRLINGRKRRASR